MRRGQSSVSPAAPKSGSKANCAMWKRGCCRFRLRSSHFLLSEQHCFLSFPFEFDLIAASEGGLRRYRKVTLISYDSANLSVFNGSDLNSETFSSSVLSFFNTRRRRCQSGFIFFHGFHHGLRAPTIRGAEMSCTNCSETSQMKDQGEEATSVLHNSRGH